MHLRIFPFVTSERLDVLQHPVLRRLYALMWSTLVTVILIQSSSHPVVGPAAPPGEPDLLREIALNAGHLVAFSVLTGLWWWAFSPKLPFTRALVLALAIALVLGMVTELLQSAVPDREASLLDMLMNTIAAFGAAWGIWRYRSV